MAGEVDQLLVKIEATTEQLRRELRRAEQQVTGFERNVDRQVGRVESRFTKMGAGISGAMRGVGAAIGGAALGREILGTITQFEQLDQRIRTLTGTAEAYNEAQSYLRETANRTATDIAAMTDQYGRLLTLQNSGLITNQQARALLEGFADAAAATGASTAQLNQVMYGLSQALSSGTVRAEEFNQVTEPMPGLLQAMEKAAGLSAGGLRKLVNEGQVTSEMFGQIMVAALQEFSGEAEKRADTIGGKWQNLNNQWVELQRSLSEPVADVLAPLLSTATSLLDKLGPIVSKIAEIEAYGHRLRNTPLQALGLMAESPDVNRARLEEERATVEAMIQARRAPGGPFAGHPQAEQGLARLEKRLQLINAQIVALDGQTHGPALPTITLDPIEVPGTPLPLPKPGGGGSKPRGGARRGKSEAERAAEEAARAAQREADAIRGVTDALAFEEQQLQRTAREQEIMSQLRAAGIDENHAAAEGIRELAGRVYDLQAASQALNDAIDDDEAFGFAKEKVEETTGAIDGMSEAILGGLQHALVSTGGRFKDLESVAVAAISHIITELIRMQNVANAAGKSGPLSGIFNAIGGLFGGGGFGGGGSIGPIVADAAAAGIPGGGFAMGGRPPVGMASLVGERGPELFVPDVAGRIIPNHAIAGAMRGGGAGAAPVFHVNVIGARGNAEIEQMVYAGIARAKPEIIAASGRHVQNARAADPRFMEKGAG